MITKLQKSTDISYYITHKDTKGRTYSLLNIFYEIRNDRKFITEKIRSCNSKEERKKYKDSLPCVAFGGLFSSRSKINCINPSGLICMDFDDVKNTYQFKEELIKSKYCFAIWVSPSGNGLKMLVKIPLVIGDERYKEYYNAALEHYKAFEPDRSTKDISRLCYLSYDPDLYVNTESMVFVKKKIAYVPIPKSRSFKTIGESTESSKIRRLFKWWNKNHWDASMRNNSLYKLAAVFCEFGVSEESAWTIIKTYEESNLKSYELRSILKSAYKRVSFDSKSLITNTETR